MTRLECQQLLCWKVPWVKLQGSELYCKCFAACPGLPLCLLLLLLLLLLLPLLLWVMRVEKDRRRIYPLARPRLCCSGRSRLQLLVLLPLGMLVHCHGRNMWPSAFLQSHLLLLLEMWHQVQ
jgi:hypothetical protein